MFLSVQAGRDFAHSKLSAPKTASKRIFFITDEDDPHPGNRAERLVKSAETTLVDLVQAGVSIEPFFISTDDKLFDLDKFYRVYSSTYLCLI